MASLELGDSNIVDADTINWRLVVYPIVAAIVLLLGGFGYYYYQINQRETLEAQARDVLLLAKSPEDFIKVADQFPNTDQATLSLVTAATLSFNKKDYDSAAKTYQRIIGEPGTNPLLRDSAQLGLASSLEAAGKIDDAIGAYLAVARRGKDSPYAPFAYTAAARLYEQKGDKENQRLVLTEAAGLGAESPFVKDATLKLKALNAAAANPTPTSTPAAPDKP
jgi:predicted negative regulator of RcsB-dependent stress response